ncbi:putative ferredoxin reductase [Arenicella chitinivorans]|uniref:Ferredoxin reductase n=1 Tax=Arenicella chitinivorans TaxID=1329800 RepID=A0A918VHY4_9GAMM|nr:FAD-dependent oxidoreductase [Arenicella chitinivorans]GGZ98130.1 putative ferredoxin reductase [Arenicella chitinivorans]
MHSVVIIGASHAATEAIATLRKLGWTDKIILIGDEPHLPYHRPPLSKAFLKGDLSADKLLIRPESFYQKHDVELHLGRRAVEIDRPANRVVLDNGEQLDYQYLILATGTRARKLPVDGADSERIHYLRTLQDVEVIQAKLTEGTKMLIVGAGYIGLEVAASALQLGCQVTVLEAMERVLARVTSETVSEFYQQVHRNAGVDLRLNASVTGFTHQPDNSQAELGDGSKLEFDIALVGIGVVANTELAAGASLVCDNGIVVNEHAQTNDPHIYAVGDCSYHHNPFYNRHLRLESVPNAVEQAKTAASSICGQAIVYDQLPWFWSDQYDLKLQTAGLFDGFDQVVVRGDQATRKFSVFYLQDGHVIAVDAINSPADFMLGKKLILSRATPDTDDLSNQEVPLKSLLV